MLTPARPRSICSTLAPTIPLVSFRVDAGIATCKFRRLSLTMRRAAWSGLASLLGNEGEESCRTTNKCGMGRMALHYWASDTSTAPIGQSELLLTLRLGTCCVQTAVCIRICICIQYVSMFGCGCIDIYVCLNRARPGYQTSKTQVEVYVDVDGQQYSLADKDSTSRPGIS
jgi:hypothetical protein